MISIDDRLVSDELFKAYFVCDLNACKGACCVEGDAGAPLETEEIDLLENELEDILPFLTDKGRKILKDKGVFELDIEGEHVTPLIEGKECAFTTFDENGIAKCGIEDAFRAGATSFRKPISCHLYPIRVHKGKFHEALNYHKWPICRPACECGAKLKVKVYKFLKDAIIRKYGEEFYEKLEEAEKLLGNSQQMSG